MKFTTILSAGLAVLLAPQVVTASPINHIQMLRTPEPRALVPSKILWQDTNGTVPFKAQNITACTAVNYTDADPGRTKIIRNDCKHLAREMQAKPGFWEMWNWSNSGAFKVLAANGTCQIAIQRLTGNATVSNSDTAIIGNQDVVDVLNANVYDFAVDEDYIDNMHTHGHFTCKYWYAVRSTFAFQLQYAGDE